MKIINFDRHFSDYITGWMRENAAKFGHNTDRMEAQMPEVYLRWINAPAAFLDGDSPAAYFDRFADAAELVAALCAYEKDKVPVPDLLLERIVALGDDSVPQLDALLDDAATPAEARLTAISLLRELESPLPLPRYVAWIAACEQPGEREELAAESLREIGPAAVAPMLAALEKATAAGEELFLDVLCNFPGDERVFQLALRKFADCPERRALFASYLGKLGDERALPALLAAIKDANTSYLDFIELRSAIEELGGDAPPERDFAGDPEYEAMRRM